MALFFCLWRTLVGTEVNVHGSYSNYKARGIVIKQLCHETPSFQNGGWAGKGVTPAAGWVLHPGALLQRVENQLNVVATGSGVDDAKAQYRLPLVLGRRYQTFSLFQKLITPRFVLVG